MFILQIGGYELDLPQFSRVVKQFGGLQKVPPLNFVFNFIACLYFNQAGVNLLIKEGEWCMESCSSKEV